MRQRVLKNFNLLLIGLMLPSASYALTLDRSQPVHITADSGLLNQRTQLNTFQGHVIITQGTTKLTAPRIEYQAQDKTVISPVSAEGRTSLIIDPHKQEKNKHS
jgi:lipopolysaccharide export system protein LptA